MMNLEEVKKYLEENKDNDEVVGFINSFKTPLTRESVEEWTKEGDGRSWLDRTCDIYSAKAIETAKNNAIAKYEKEVLQTKIEEAIKAKDDEGLTEEQKELRELKAEMEAMKKDKIKAELSSKFTKTLTDKGLPTDLIDFILADDEDIINNNISKFETMLNPYVESVVNERLKGSYKPPKNDGNPLIVMSKEQLLSKGMAFMSSFSIEHPEEYKKIMNS